MTCTFDLPIGDWSDDGHGKCDYFTISANATYEEISDIFKKMDEEYHLTSLFESYDDNALSDFDFERLIDHVPSAINLFEDDNSLIDGTTSAAELFILAMMTFDPRLELELVPKKCLYQAAFGYGLFD